MRAHPVTVRAHYVALRNLCFEHGTVLQHHAALACAEIEKLVSWIAVIEVHHPRREASTAVHTGDATKFTQPIERCLLATRDALDLLLAMTRVIGNVVRTLVPCTGHVPS